ncbi:MAG: hypothetical protein U0175_10450 [Caldilineaceae bacterium]
MSSKFDVQKIRLETMDETSVNLVSPDPVYQVAETFSIERRPESALVVQKSLSAQEVAWLPKSVAQIAVRSGVSTATLFGILLLAMLALYGAFTISTVNIWDTLSTHGLTGVASLAMIYGAQAIIGILLSLIEEEDPLRLVSRFMQSIGASFLFGGAFLTSGWIATQWLRSILSLYVDQPIATGISVLLLAISTQCVLQALIGVYHTVNPAQSNHPAAQPSNS